MLAWLALLWMTLLAVAALAYDLAAMIIFGIT
jgi:hypothetical protein